MSSEARSNKIPRPGPWDFILCLCLCAPAAIRADELPRSEGPPLSLTLPECYALALKRSEEVAIRQEVIIEAEGRFLKAFSGVLPRASFDLSEKRQDGSGNSAFTLREVPERKFFFSQPLFSGFKEFVAMAASRAERRQRRYEKTRAEQLLLVDVSDAFYLFLQQREDRQVLEAIRTTLLERLDELHARERLGRARPSEVASAEAQLRRIEAEGERVRSLEITTRQLLEFLTGIDQIEAIADGDPALPFLDEEAMYLVKAGARPDVQATEEAWQVAQDGVKIAKSGFWPTAGLEANYYTKRVGVSKDIDWDVLLKVDVPIFQGTQAMGEVKQASAQAREAKLTWQRTQRQAALDVRDVYAQSAAALSRYAALEKARAAAEENYRLQVDDYQRNLVGNLEVLKALQDLQDVRREALSAKYDTKRLSWQLRVATGETL